MNVWVTKQHAVVKFCVYECARASTKGWVAVIVILVNACGSFDVQVLYFSYIGSVITETLIEKYNEGMNCCYYWCVCACAPTLTTELQASAQESGNVEGGPGEVGLSQEVGLGASGQAR